MKHKCKSVGASGSSAPGSWPPVLFIRRPQRAACPRGFQALTAATGPHMRPGPHRPPGWVGREAPPGACWGLCTAPPALHSLQGSAFMRYSQIVAPIPARRRPAARAAAAPRRQANRHVNNSSKALTKDNLSKRIPTVQELCAGARCASGSGWAEIRAQPRETIKFGIKQGAELGERQPRAGTRRRRLGNGRAARTQILRSCLGGPAPCQEQTETVPC